MATYESKMLAVSRAGHDKGRLYAVIREEDPYLYLVNGTTRKLAGPKRKKRMHVQVIRHLPEDLEDVMKRIQDDSDVRRILEQYQRAHQ